MFRLLAMALALLAVTVGSLAQQPPAEHLVFDFENLDDLKSWSNIEPPHTKTKEPAARIELSKEHATSGKQSLKVTFAGGNWPAITTTHVHDDWLPYQTFHADVWAPRPCVVGFTALQEKSERGEGWEQLVSRWTKTVFLSAGANHVEAALPGANDYAINKKWGKVVRFEIFMYNPRDGESIFVDNVRLSAKKTASPTTAPSFPLAGTDLVLSGKGGNEVSSARAVIELGKRLKDGWTKPEAKTLDEVEEAFSVQYAELKKKHPKAILAVLRDGEKGYDPAAPDKVYAGWKDAYFNSHGPDSNYVDRARNKGKSASHEVFMRHRSPLMRADLSSIPVGSNILAAKLIIVRANDKIQDDHNPQKKPTMWVVEPCNRPWDEFEVNAFQFAKDKFWKAVGGMHWGDDPDFLPLFLAHGPGQGKVNTWDFTEAVRFWTSGKQANHGFMLHGDSHDYMIAHSREAKEVRDRPAVLVIYEGK
jgi:hypothetical protein